MLSFDPLTGERVWFQYIEHDDTMVITHEQDAEPVVKIAHELAVDGDYSKQGIKRDLWHYAKVLNTDIMRMKVEDGVDFFDKNDEKRVFYLLNTKYKHCKTTAGYHWG